MKSCARCHEAWSYKPKTQLIVTCGKCKAIIPDRGSCMYCGCTDHPKSERRDICPHCGYVEGESLVPSAWACEECAYTDLDHGGDLRPICPECGSQMSCLVAKPSGVCGAGIGDPQLEMGLELLMEAQEADLNLGSELLRDAQEDV